MSIYNVHLPPATSGCGSLLRAPSETNTATLVLQGMAATRTPHTMAPTPISKKLLQQAWKGTRKREQIIPTTLPNTNTRLS